MPIKYPHYFAPHERVIFRLAMELSLRTARAIIAISHSTARDLGAWGVPAQRLSVIPEAADPAFAPQPEHIIAAVRARYHLPGHYVLYLGSNKPHKNLVRLVEAWKITNTKFQISNRPIPNPQSPIPNLQLVIAGHWDDRFPQPRQRAAELRALETIYFAGPVDEADLPALYSGADLFVFPSLYEGFGLPVLEAMACGTPVICSQTSSLPEVAGEAALLTDPSKASSIAEAMGRALGDPGLRQEMREKGLAQAARFSWERTAQETLAVYRSVTKGLSPERSTDQPPSPAR
jgi:alpha-1,3-rhamnosyl/mannosyltransferase